MCSTLHQAELPSATSPARGGSSPSPESTPSVALLVRMLPETALAALVDADVVVDRHLRQVELRQPVAVLGAHASLAAQRLHHQREARAADLLRGLLVQDVQ